MIEDTGLRVAWSVGFGILGLAVGSFLNVVIWRVPRQESVVRPASHCPSCDAPLKLRDNVPVLSWLVLRGRCRVCGERISVRYPLVEAATGALFAGIAWKLEADWALPAFLVLAAALVAIALIDLEHYIVPNRIVGPVVMVSIALLVVAAAVEGEWGDLARALAGAFAAFGGLLVVHLISPAGMGMGDVKLAFLLGLLLGWINWGHVAVGLFLGFLYGAIIGGALVLTGRRGRKQAVPFAPFLAAGTLTAVFVGQPILDWYSGI